MPLPLIATVVVAFAGAVAVAFAHRAKSDRAARWALASVLFAGGALVAWWSWSLAPLTAGFVWLPVVIGGIAIAFVMAVLSRRRSAPSGGESPVLGVGGATTIYIGFLLAVLGITLAATLV